MLGVEPDGLWIEWVFFAEIYDGVGAVDALKSECSSKFVECEEFAVILGRPAEEAEEVDEGLRQEAGIAVGGDADHGTMLALGKFGAIGGDEQGQVCKLRRIDSESLEDEQVLEGVGEVILAADDVADVEIGVVRSEERRVGKECRSRRSP